MSSDEVSAEFDIEPSTINKSEITSGNVSPEAADIEPSAKKQKIDELEQDSVSVTSQDSRCIEEDLLDKHGNNEVGSDENSNFPAHFSPELLKNIATQRGILSLQEGPEKLCSQLALDRAIKFFEILPTCDVKHELEVLSNFRTTSCMINKLAKNTKHQDDLKYKISSASRNFKEKMEAAAKSRIDRVKNLEIERFLLKTPSSAKEAMTDVCEDEQAAKANVYLWTISLLAMGFTMPELKQIEDWTFYNMKREAIKDPLYGVYFIKTGTEYYRYERYMIMLPVHSNFLPTARYLGENKEIWHRIRKNFVLTKSYNFYATKIRGIALFECEAFRNYMADGGQLQDIRDYVNSVIEEYESPKYASKWFGMTMKYRPEYTKRNTNDFMTIWLNALRQISRKDEDVEIIKPYTLEEIAKLHFKILQGSQEIDTK